MMRTYLWKRETDSGSMSRSNGCQRVAQQGAKCSDQKITRLVMHESERARLHFSECCGACFFQEEQKIKNTRK
jgi:hypothetical protein